MCLLSISWQRCVTKALCQLHVGEGNILRVESISVVRFQMDSSTRWEHWEGGAWRNVLPHCVGFMKGVEMHSPLWSVSIQGCRELVGISLRAAIVGLRRWKGLMFPNRVAFPCVIRLSPQTSPIYIYHITDPIQLPLKLMGVAGSYSHWEPLDSWESPPRRIQPVSAAQRELSRAENLPH